jgi:hypothetical protein
MSLAGVDRLLLKRTHVFAPGRAILLRGTMTIRVGRSKHFH